MTGRRVTYVFTLVLTLVFYLVYRQWFSWLLFLGVLWLPVLSLALSLPAMLTAKAQLRLPEQVRAGVPAKTALTLKSRFPQPPVEAVIRLTNALTGEVYVGEPGEYVPVEHCGLVTVGFKALKVYDYLGLFSRKLKSEETYDLLVLPKAVPAAQPTPAQQQLVTRWIPKAGGGFSENHDLRPYREGDNPRLIHWKMAAKVGKLIYREPIVPVQEEVLLVLTLSGTPEELDRKLGRLEFLGRRLLEQQTEFSILCRTGTGVLTLPVTDKKSRDTALRAVLAGPCTQGEWLPEGEELSWVCVIGGQADEA